MFTPILYTTPAGKCPIAEFIVSCLTAEGQEKEPFEFIE